jgi:UDP-N-acetylmuramoyl-L-alanyl-D-glutamate--2,6-diaminopimelate ligase
MKLSLLIENIKLTNLVGDTEREVLSLSQDSRDDLKEGSCYFAVRGHRVDGHQFINDAIEKGAQIIFCEELPESTLDTVTYVVVPKVSDVLGTVASTFYGNPSKNMKVVGVTGTNGKTSVATTMYEILTALGFKTILLSTVHNIIGTEVKASVLTTGSPLEIQRMLKRGVDMGCTHVCMEVSSHSLDQGRVQGIEFDIGIFTNLTQDHLDYHKTMENYAASKKRLFDMLNPSSLAITNIDSEYGSYMVSDTQAQVISYGTQKSDYQFQVQNIDTKGTTFSINDQELHIPLIGMFNVYNTASVYAACIHLGVDTGDLVRQCSILKGARGRLQLVHSQNKEGVLGVVDYAHTPDALENVLSTLSELPHHRIITVFGCGGDRDATKRPLMAEVTQRYSDIIVVTNDNPRTEDPQQIISDIQRGFTEDFQYQVVLKREEAIKRAVDEAQRGDIVLLAGKGHEDYQIIGTTKHHLDDVEVLTRFL